MCYLSGIKGIYVSHRVLGFLNHVLFTGSNLFDVFLGQETNLGPKPF